MSSGTGVVVSRRVDWGGGLCLGGMSRWDGGGQGLGLGGKGG